MLFRLLRDHLRPYRARLGAIALLQLGSTGAMLYLPNLNARIIDDGVTQGDTGLVFRVGALMLVVCLGQIVCQIAAVWFSARVAMAVGRDLRAAMFDRITGFSGREVGRFGAPSLITRVTNDVQQVQMLTLMTCSIAVSVPIMMLGGIGMAMWTDLSLSWIFAVVVPVMFLAVGIVIRGMVPSFRAQQGRIDVVNRVLREQITGIRVVRAFVREPEETDRFEDANARLTEVSVRAGRWLATLFPLVLLIVNGASVAVIWFGGHEVDDGSLGVGQLTAFISYLMQIVMSVMMGTFMLMQIPRAAVCADRIGEVLATESSVHAPEDPVTDLPEHATIRFDHVGFTHPGAASPVLSDVSFRAGPGQTVAVIGSTGSGKTTLVDLVPRLMDATEGTVAVGGVDVRRVAPEVLWSRVGLVPQRAFLFSGTIASNLRHGRPGACDDELWEALEVAQAKDFVAALPDGLESSVAQGGTNFPGGQRQRLAIARALVRKPDVYLFDDSFSALDLATDARLRAALRPWTTDSCVLVVAQRISTIRDADLILVLDDGHLVGAGTHDELTAGCPTYAEIVASQLSAEEAA